MHIDLKNVLLPVDERCHQRSNIMPPKRYLVEPKELDDDVWYEKILTLKQIRASHTAATRLEEEESKCEKKCKGESDEKTYHPRRNCV